MEASHANTQQAGKMTAINKTMLNSKYPSPPLTCSFLCVKVFCQEDRNDIICDKKCRLIPGAKHIPAQHRVVL